MVDRDVLASKVDAIRAHAGRLRAGGAMDRALFLAEQNVQDAAFFNIVQSLQAAVDLGAHVIADSGWETPASLGQVFAILAREGVIPADLSIRLASLAGLRNLVVHRYGAVDLGRVHADLPGDVDALERFADILQSMP